MEGMEEGKAGMGRPKWNSVEGVWDGDVEKQDKYSVEHIACKNIDIYTCK